MADAEGNVVSEERALKTLTRPVHSETLLYEGKRFSVIVIQDENPRIEWTRQDERGTLHSAPLKRIVGARMLDKAQATFQIFWVPQSKESDREGSLKACTWTVPSGHAEAVLLCDAIDCWIHGVASATKLPRRQLHAFVNPFSGVAGTSLEIWAQVKKMFQVASIQVNETLTTHQGHAEDVCGTIDLDECKDGILVVSGDGLFHEVVNGLLHRVDWEKAKEIPLGVIPAGSGNGLARSLQTWNPMEAALAIVKGRTEHLDTWSVVANNQRRFAILSIEWGTIASIDFDSEAARFLGGARFHLWSFLKLVNRQRYTAAFSYLPGTEEITPKIRELQASLQREQFLRSIEAANNRHGGAPHSSPISSPRKDTSSATSTRNDGSIDHAPFLKALSTPSDGEIFARAATPDSSISKSSFSFKKGTGNDSSSSPIDESSPEIASSSSSPTDSVSATISSQSDVSEDTRTSELSTLVDATDSSPVSQSEISPTATSSSSSPSNDSDSLSIPQIDGIEGENLRNLPGVPLKHLLARKDEWMTFDNDWMLILGLNTTHMAHNVYAAPRASISDGLIDVLTISKPSRRVLLRMIMAMEKGTHVTDPDVSYLKARAFSIRPNILDEKHRLMGVDGEKLMADRVDVEVHPRLLSIFCDPDALTEAALSNPHSFLSKELEKLNCQLIEDMKREVANMPDDPQSPRSSNPATIASSTSFKAGTTGSSSTEAGGSSNSSRIRSSSSSSANEPATSSNAFTIAGLSTAPSSMPASVLKSSSSGKSAATDAHQ